MYSAERPRDLPCPVILTDLTLSLTVQYVYTDQLLPLFNRFLLCRSAGRKQSDAARLTSHNHVKYYWPRFPFSLALPFDPLWSGRGGGPFPLPLPLPVGSGSLWSGACDSMAMGERGGGEAAAALWVETVAAASNPAADVALAASSCSSSGDAPPAAMPAGAVSAHAAARCVGVARRCHTMREKFSAPTFRKILDFSIQATEKWC